MFDALTVDPAIAAAARLSLALLFAQAAWHKLRDLGAFRRALYAYDLVPDGALTAVSVALPLAEAAVVVALVAPTFAQPLAAVGGLGALTLLFLFTAAVAANVARGKRDVDCGCGSPALSPYLGPGLIARNLAALAVAYVAALPTAERGLGWLDGVTVLGAVVTATVLWQIVNRLLIEETAHRRLVTVR